MFGWSSRGDNPKPPRELHGNLRFTLRYQDLRVVFSPSSGVHEATTKDPFSTRVRTTRVMAAVNSAIAEGSSMGTCWLPTKRATSVSRACRACPSIRASPKDNSSPSGALCIENRGSRRRSCALRETESIANHRWPSRIGASIPESRGAPSRRRVAITACRWLSNLPWTATAKAGSACRKSDHVTVILIQPTRRTLGVRLRRGSGTDRSRRGSPDGGGRGTPGA